jgi:exodeoxyribonuclease-5
MRHPDITLEKIHRQVAGSPILAVAHRARHGLPPELGDHGPVKVLRRGAMQAMVDRWIEDDAQVACGRNATRRMVNLLWRVAHGWSAPLVEGERLIVLFNDRGRGVYNGTMLKVLAVTGETEHGWSVDVEDDGGQRRKLSVWRQALGGGKWTSEEKPSDHVVVDFAYAITVHKSQGGEWPRFAVIDEEAHAWDHARWRYTAFTRAKEQLFIHL